MALFKKRPKTSQQKAQKAQLGILARILGCAYLIYIVYQMFQQAPEDETINYTLKIAIGVIFIAAAAFLLIITAFEFVRNYKSGFYKAEAYSDDVSPEFMAQNEAGEEEGEEGEEEEEEEEEEDENSN